MQAECPNPASLPRLPAASSNLLSFLDLLRSAQTGSGVGNANVEFFGSLDEYLARASTERVGELGTVRAIVHEECFQFLLVVHQELAEAIGQDELRLLVIAVANLGHRAVATELSTHAVVYAVGSTPVGGQTLELVALETLELGVVLLHLSQPTQRHHHPYLLPLACADPAYIQMLSVETTPHSSPHYQRIRTYEPTTMLPVLLGTPFSAKTSTTA